MGVQGSVAFQGGELYVAEELVNQPVIVVGREEKEFPVEWGLVVPE